MPDDFELNISIDTKLVRKALKDFQAELFWAIDSAGEEAAQEILKTAGVKTPYPPEPSTRHRPPSAYVRGIGYINKDGRVTQGSERYGTQWNVKSYKASMKTVLGNRASYAKYLGGSGKDGEGGQSTVINKNISGQGWRILEEVADEKINKITRIYEEWIKRALRKVGLI